MTGACNSIAWIINNGATHHITGSFSCLSDVRRTHPCPVGLPDGKSALATHEGRVQLAPNIILTHVLFVPQFSYNLIAVSRLIDDSKCIVQFTNSLCAIQDLRSGSLIGVGERRDGLYYFCGLPAAHATSVPGLTAFELWHRRLGHPRIKWLSFCLQLSLVLVVRL